MRWISAWLTAVAVSRRAALVSLAVALLAVGMVGMHATSGLTTAHAPHLVTATHAAPQPGPTALPDQHVTGLHGGVLGLCADGCDVHEVAAALCLVALAALLTLAIPRPGPLALGSRMSRRRIAPTATGARTAAPPSLVALGISRT